MADGSNEGGTRGEKEQFIEFDNKQIVVVLLRVVNFC